MIGGMRVEKSDDSSSITSGDSDYGTVTGSTFSGTLSQYRQVRHMLSVMSAIVYILLPQTLQTYTLTVSTCIDMHVIVSTVLYFYSICSHDSHTHMILYVHYTWCVYSLSLSLSLSSSIKF